ncbi:hypothetical protein [Sphingomonas sp. RB1R13]|uniref:hypothetical protein n=1 Tax=Sphingomonas sp. RB1R13 TaxID=3096159 RepID=UPI002FC5D97D
MASIVIVMAAPAAVAQQVQAPAGYAPLTAPCVVQGDGRCTAITADAPMPVASRAERLVLASSNVAAAPATTLGGLYVVNQMCSGYGTVVLRYLAADGSTMLPLVSRSTGDSGGGTTLYLGAGTVVDVQLSGMTGCGVQLARVPA